MSEGWDVGLRGEPNRGLRAAFAATFLFGSIASFPATSNAETPLVREQADPPIRELVRRASKGNRSARLELGVRLQEGRGVARDAEKACALFETAAKAESREVWLYTPSTRSVQRYERNAGPKSRVDEELEYRAFLCRQGARAPAAKP